MVITLCMVLSVDGKSTKHQQTDQSWASKEDGAHLSKLISENNLILMGGKTYETAKSHMQLSKDKSSGARAGALRIIVTRNPEKYSEDKIEEQLEFMSGSVSEIVANLEKRGFEKMLLLSGENLNKEFFEEGLIDEIYLTVEPKVFGSGNLMVSESDLDINLQLMEIDKLNEQGAILLRYKVVRTRS